MKEFKESDIGKIYNTDILKIDINKEDLIEDPLWYHKEGLMQTSTGYGSKLVTEYKINFEGRLHRVYCMQYSNAGSLYFLSRGRLIIVS